MTQSSTEDMTPSTWQETQKQQRKQTKRASKLRLKVEQARGDVQKAEQKMAKARVNYEVASARLRTLEAELTEMQGGSERR